jgi:exopolysaccharide biosynthesis predicted pyruvyltransferase EpsI
MHVVETVRALQDETDAILRRHIRPGSDVALLDFPRHQNAGDSLIWLGERSYAGRLGLAVKYTADLHCFSPAELRRLMPNGTILLHGGGNFGDRWQQHHDHRLALIAEFPDYHMVQLPQGLDFSSAQAADKTAAIIQAHGNITLLVRDHTSVGVAKSLINNTIIDYCPDLALGVGPLDRLAEPQVQILLLLRKDSESTGHQANVPAGVSTRTLDWGLAGANARSYARLRRPENLARVLPLLERPVRPSISRSLEAMARLNVDDARNILAMGQVVVTDRLHAMVIAALSSIPVVALDNANGKVSAIHRDYVHELPATYLASDMNDAIEMAASLI